MTVNYKLKSLRIDKNITQRQLADFLYITVSAYSRKELGMRNFTIDEARKLAELFDTTIESIFLGED